MLKKLGLSIVLGVGMCVGGLVWAYGLIQSALTFQTGGTAMYLALSAGVFCLFAHRVR